MSIDKKEFETWEEVIVGFLRGKSSDEEETYLKKTIKKISECFKKRKYFGEDEIKDFFDPKKNKKDKSQNELDFQKLKFKQIFEISKQPEEISQPNEEEAYQQKCFELAQKYQPKSWIAMASKNASSVSFATHVIKLTHSKIDSTSIYDSVSANKVGILTTSDLNEIIVDGAVAGNQFAPIFQFLELELNGKKLATEFDDERNTILNCFSSSSDELKGWNIGFKQALESSKKSSHFLAKQIYFPVISNNEESFQDYHLLCPVKSSSLAHTIFLKLKRETENNIKIIRDKNKFSELSYISYPKKAAVKVTASNHNNASQLNGKRGGSLRLFCALPPTWQSNLKSPVGRKSFFGEISYFRIKDIVEYLRDFLLTFQKINLSIKDPKKKKWIDDWVNQIIDEVINYAISIQRLPAGWSIDESIKLKPEHQYFLDPFRDDDSFQNARNTNNWQSVICKDFASWLNKLLAGKDKQFTPQKEHTRIWKELMEIELREHAQDIKWDIKRKNREGKS